VKITNLSLAVIAVVGMMSVASADVDVDLGGQAVVYYQTSDASGTGDLFNQDSSLANFGLQLDATSDIGNGFGLGVQASALNASGLNKNLVSNVMQAGGGDLDDAENYFGITKAYLTKNIGKTTLKMGRQELPKSLSPLAFSEGWNVFKNTFDAVVAINNDVPDTTVVGAYVSSSNGNGIANDMTSFDDLAGGAAEKGAYMLTVANKSVQNVPMTLSYYSLPSTDLSAVWADVQAKQLGPVNVGLQGGMVMNDASGGNDTTGLGVKVSGKAGPADLTVAYSTVDDGDVPIHNVGTNVKTPLYTQMILNQGAIKSDNDTVMLKAAAPAGPGKVIGQYAYTTDNSIAENDYNELDLIYKFKALGTTMLAAYVMQDGDAYEDPNNVLRFWTRYNF